MRRFYLYSVMITFLFATHFASANTDRVVVKGLFAGSAVLEVNGKAHMLKEGASTPEGITLLRATSKYAQIEQQGEIKKLGLNRQVGGTYTSTEPASVELGRRPDGHFLTPGRINNRWVEFMVDTGATSVTLNSFTAELLGIAYRDAKTVQVGTAQGNTQAYQVILSSVAVGDVLLTNVSAFVIEGRFPQTILLGNTFLSRVNMRVENSAMTLQAKF
ncbi:MAG TPA: TIGR02281 family clan AA aspartic protease [Marinagarivorans sp.]